MKDSRLYTPGELEAVKNPSENLNGNGDKNITKKERIEMIVSSKSFTVAASVLTLGFYYLYYLFCLEQEQDSPFVPHDKGVGSSFSKKERDALQSLGERKYTYEKPDSAYPVYQEAMKMNKRMANFASGKENRDPAKKIILQSGKTILEKAKFIISVNISNLLSWMEGIAMYVRHQEWKVKKKIEQSEEEEHKMKDLIKQTIERKVSGKQRELLEDVAALDISIAPEKSKPKKDHYLTFVFYATYLLLSLLTLGIFPIYHLCIKNRWNDFQSIKKHREHSCLKEFNDLTGRLMGTEGGIEYSHLLLSKKGLPLHLNFFSDVFRTKVFKIKDVRSKIITFLMIISLGFFGIFVLTKNVFEDNKLTLEDENIKPTNYSKIENTWERFKFFMMDLFKDIDIASKIAAKRVATINRSVSDLLTGYRREESWMVKFIRLLSSELYFWLFAFIFICSSITFIIVYASWYQDFYKYFLFWFSSIVSISFLGLFTRHIRLLFV